MEAYERVLLNIESKEKFEELVLKIHTKILSSAASITLVGQSKHEAENFVTVLAVYDQYFRRVDSRVSLSVMFSYANGQAKVSSIGSGGGKSAFFSFDWGAGDNISLRVKDILDALGAEYQ